jgi:flagellar hook protein FlgE
MSLSAALSTAVSAISAQSRALATISENIANSSTTAYKTKNTTFASLVAGTSGSSYSSGGVQASTMQNMLVQGLISTDDNATSVAIDGEGFFVVASDPNASASAYVYTRNGSFTTDANGYLINSEGYYLMAYPTDANGDVLASNTNSLAALEPISANAVSGAARATTTVSMSANLPADAAIGDQFASSIEIVDSLGVAHTIEQTWTKTGANSWTLDLSAAHASDDATSTTGTVSPSSFTITFDENGLLASTSPASNFSVSGYTTGAADSSITLDLGAAGSASGLTQFAATSSSIDIEISNVDHDGARYGSLTEITIDDNGLVTARFDNGLEQAIYQIPVATFDNASGLKHLGGSVYDEAAAAGTLNLSRPTADGAGSIVAGALEGSTTDTATEFNKMIIAQQAYSAASQLISVADDLFDTLIQAVR